MTTIDLSTQNFEETLSSSEIVLIDFWATWCGPCRNFAPVYEKSADTHTDITFAKVDVDAEQELAAAAQVTSVPTIMAIRQGIPVFSQPGALPADALEDVIAQVRALDMDEVRSQVQGAQQGGSPEGGRQGQAPAPAQGQGQGGDRPQATGAGVDYPDDNGAIV